MFPNPRYLRLFGEVVGGRALSGMSTTVVTPPAAAAFVAVVNPKMKWGSNNNKILRIK